MRDAVGGERRLRGLMGRHRILAWAREAGGAAALAPVLRKLQQRAQVLILAKDYAEPVFDEHGLAPVPCPVYADATIQRILAEHMNGERPDVLVTSMASLPQLDMTERYLWRWAKRQGIPSIGVLDQWQYYALRFSGPGPDESLHYLPDWVTAMDEEAKRGLVEAGVPEGCIVITGQPAFDRLRHVREADNPESRAGLRSTIGVAPNARLMCFVAESFAGVFGDRLGYTEHSALCGLIGVCRRLVAGSGRPMHLAVKLHPENTPEQFSWLSAVSLPQGLRLTMHRREPPSIPLLMASDVVVGMTSVLLVESILLGRPTVSFQPGARQTDGLIATVIGAIPLLADEETCLGVLQGVLSDARFRAAYLGRQAQLSTDGRATERVVGLVQRVIGSRFVTAP